MIATGAAGERPIVIAHRGASGYLPEHTLEAYELAIRQGADFIEPDLVLTADGVLVCRHENVLASVEIDQDGAPLRDGRGNPVVAEATTDVAERAEFRERLTTKRIRGRMVTGWFSEDFTLAEIRRLRARERMPRIRPESASHDGRYGIATFDEVIELVRRWGASGRKVGVYPETKAPTYFLHTGRTLSGRPIGLDITATLAERLSALAFTDPRRVFIQSFEVANLVALKRRHMPHFGFEVPLVQLLGDLRGGAGPTPFRTPPDIVHHLREHSDLDAIYGDLARELDIAAGATYGDLVTAQGLELLKRYYAAGIGPNKDFVLRRSASKEGLRLTGEVAPFVASALREGLLIHPYTLRRESAFESLDERGARLSSHAEALRLFAAGVHGVFTDQPDHTLAALRDYQSSRVRQYEIRSR
jgi:glycerophosphoryl diester phosphodiesterase